MNRLILFLTAIVLLGIAGFVMVLLGTHQSPDERAAEILEQLSAAQYATVYEEATSEFRGKQTEERFAAVMGDFHGNLGAFRAVTKVADRTPEPAADQTRATLDLTLSYERGKAACRIVLTSDERTPRLVDIGLRKLPD